MADYCDLCNKESNDIEKLPNGNMWDLVFVCKECIQQRIDEVEA